MITPHEFPYLQSLVINDAYAVKNLTVPVFKEGEEFKHLILTGRNGSGKTTVLRALSDFIRFKILKESESYSTPPLGIGGGRLVYPKAIDKSGTVRPFFSTKATSVSESHSDLTLTQLKSQLLLSFFEAARGIKVRDVTTVVQESELEARLTESKPNQSPAEFFKQYLVNKKVFQVFDTMEGKQEGAKQQEQFFTKLEETLAKIFEDPGTKLEFVRESFEFYINLSDGRRFTFNQLSAGFSAFLSILTELLMRTDLLRKQANDYTYDPCGFVLIDEPETHLHLEMQYQILPLLTGLFPNLQFIVATHSPAVASSIKNATVFDLSTRQTTGDQAAGSSYSELMQTHFGVENEYSNVADAIIKRINALAQLPDKADARRQLQALLVSEGRYMSPALRLEVEAQLIGLEVEE
ncbi:AAA family ATPase [Hymenobacter terrenus]|uniref:AAA family ATPase n=1 Tax=Hymenobacter terrenus TaxID=1629124 RepID=UPI000619404E|nr:AAA family ATPase [Hymenobacter terrenus]